jgi:hypothetical protein
LGEVGLKALRRRPAKSGKHSKTAVLDLGLTVSVKLFEVPGKAEGIEALRVVL